MSAEDRAEDRADDTPAEHWHVANGTPGYLFDTDDDPPTFATRAEATAYARGEALDERDNRNDAASYARVWRNGGLTDRAERVPLAREDRYTADLRVGRAGEFAVSIDRPHYAYGLPYEWRGWPCTDDHAGEESE